MNIKIAAALLSAFMSLPVLAQMASQSVDTSILGGANAGQSFVATYTTQVTKISVKPLDPYTGTLYIYEGNAGSGFTAAVGTPLYAQAGISLPSTPFGGPMRDIVLATPLPVIAGRSYTFILDASPPLLGSTTDLYTDGGFFTNYGLLFAAPFDLAFQIWAAPAATPTSTPTSIPTLSQWGLIAMSSLLALFAVFAVPQLRRRK
jgi:hypothetical protein